LPIQFDPAPASQPDVLLRYRDLLTRHRNRHAELAARLRLILQILGGVGIVLVWLTMRSLHGAFPAWPFLVGFAAIGFLVSESLRRQSGQALEQRLIDFYEKSLRRVENTPPDPLLPGDPIPEPGIELRPPDHLYERDLDLLGADSLFALLATVRTGPGQRGLARYLLDPAPHAETILRQQAVRELLPQTALREQIALLGASKFHQISGTFFDDWLDEVPPTFHPIFRPILILTAFVGLALLFAGLFHFKPWAVLFPNIVLVYALQIAICAFLRPRVMPVLKGGARLELNVRLLRDGLALLQQSGFTCEKLVALQRASLEPAGAVPTLKSLIGSLTIVEQRTKEYFNFVSLLTAAGAQAAISIAKWKRQHASAMRTWLAAWSEFEALNALATYAFEHPENAWPDLLPPTHPPLFEAIALAHPLLPEAVPNDVSLGNQEKFFLISGSNMSGKSTLLRSIGINAVLAYAGAPVRAASLRLTPLALGASLALTDSLAEGRSKFKAEVARLSAIVHLSDTTPVLFLVDEIFSGTNSADRHTAAAAVLKRLLANQAIGALSTHDLALTELATPENAGQNVHMASPDPEDPLAFDYQLKPGPNTTTNALAIIRMMGI